MGHGDRHRGGKRDREGHRHAAGVRQENGIPLGTTSQDVDVVATRTQSPDRLSRTVYLADASGMPDNGRWSFVRNQYYVPLTNIRCCHTRNSV